MQPYDLHNHSIVSKDGATPADKLINLAVSRGLKGIGICDHDEFPDIGLYDYAQRKGIKLALGTEFSCDNAHIIGYNMVIDDALRARFEPHFAALRNDYVSASKKVIAGLQGGGVDISYEKVQAAYKKENVQKIFILKYLAEQLGLYPSWAEARKDLQTSGLYVKDNENGPLSPAEAIDVIHGAGGVAIWAHPFITPPEVRAGYFELFHQHGIDAVEASYAYKQNGYKGDETNAELESTVRALLKQMQIPISGGSDSHVPVKTYADRTPILPGDFGITEEEFKAIGRVAR